MKTVLFPTDCSAASARSLRNWLANQPGSFVHLTVVHVYDLTPGTPIDKFTLREARQQADERLRQWLPSVRSGLTASIESRVVFGDLEINMLSFLMTYAYDQLLFDESSYGLTSRVNAYLNLTPTELEPATSTDRIYYQMAA